jgi:hypothetical protein
MNTGRKIPAFFLVTLGTTLTGLLLPGRVFFLREGARAQLTKNPGGITRLGQAYDGSL